MAWLSGTGGNDKLVDTLGVDFILGYGGNDKIWGLDGGDRIETGRGNDRAFGGDGFDTFVEEATKKDAGIRVRNLFDGGDGTDSLQMSLDDGFSARRDVIKINVDHGDGTFKVTHHDYLDTFVSVESFYLDTKLRVVFRGSAESELVESGAGADLLVGNGGADLFWGRAGRDVLKGNADSDDLYGGAGKDKLLGGTGDDALHGGASADILRGGSGGDWLEGGGGIDKLYGGADAAMDTFVFADVSESGPALADMDVIHQFTPGTDQFNLLAIDANTGVAGDQGFAFNGTGGPAANSVWYERNGSDLLVYADNDGDAIADMGIRVTGVAALDAFDFIL